nr:Submandibular gland secretory Glx-rich protein like [Ipomoea batatas]
MLTALRLATARTPPPALCATPLPPRLRGRSHIRLRRPVTTGAADSCPDAADDMEKVNDTEKPAAPRRPAAAQPPKVGDTMSSFGEGYATRKASEGSTAEIHRKKKNTTKLSQEMLLLPLVTAFYLFEDVRFTGAAEKQRFRRLVSKKIAGLY